MASAGVRRFAIGLDTNTYSVPPEHVGKTVYLRADDSRVRVICDGIEVASHPRCWDRRCNIEDPAHIQKLLDRKKGVRGPRARERLVALCPEARPYLSEMRPPGKPVAKSEKPSVTY